MTPSPLSGNLSTLYNRLPKRQRIGFACNLSIAVTGFAVYPGRMEGSRLPQPVHEKDETPPAPGELELVRGFLSLHDHERGNPDALSPAPESLRWWLASNRLIPPRAKGGRSDLIWGLRIRSALISKVRENMGEPSDRDAA